MKTTFYGILFCKHQTITLYYNHYFMRKNTYESSTRTRYSLHVLCGLMTLFFVSVSDAVTERLLRVAQEQFRGSEEYVFLPEKSEDALTHLHAFMTGQETSLCFRTLSPFITHIAENAKEETPWRLRTRWNANGAAAFAHIPQPKWPSMRRNFHAEIPDYTLFYSTLRYSTITDTSTFAHAIETVIDAQPCTNHYLFAQYGATEATTPNLQSGACYSYTNTRTVLHANIAGTNVLFSLSSMDDISTPSERGAVVGPPEDDLFYYSKQRGINIRGLTWVESRMYVSKSLVVYIDLPDGTTGVGMFSWVNAGWSDINVTLYFHIYTVLKDAIKTLNNTVWNPALDTKKLSRVLQTIEQLPSEKVNMLYAAYCAYVEEQYEEAKPTGLFRRARVWENAPALVTLFDQDELAQMPDNYRRALIAQEYVRSLVHRHTWSTPDMFSFAATESVQE